MLCKHLVAFSADVIYVAALLCFSFLIDWMSVIGVYVLVLKRMVPPQFD